MRIETIDLINNIGKIFIINSFLYFVSIRISNRKSIILKEYSIIFFLNLFVSFIYTFLIQYIRPLVIAPIIYFLYFIVLANVSKDRIHNYINIATLSFVIAYMIYLISIIISGILLKILIPSIDYRNPISLLTIPIIISIIFWLLSKIRRFKKGFNFINNIKARENSFIFIMGIITMAIFGLLQDSQNITLNVYLTFLIIITTITIIVWIPNKITKYYRKKLRDKTIEMQQDEIDKQKSLIEELTSQNLELSSIIHRYNNRLSALELSIKEQMLNLNTEFSTELLSETRNLSSQFSNEVLKVSNKNIVISKTNIIGIDNIFRYMAMEADKNNIKFNLKINESINYLIQNIIKQSQFETLIGDHIKDSIIAINTTNNEVREIMIILGVVDNCYELCIYDTGIEFEIETLLKLGLEPITTYKDEGGSGIGFMTTFETLKECKGSLIIEEYEKSKSNYTKSVTIRFDGKNEYRIKSYRAGEMKKRSKDNRIIIECL